MRLRAGILALVALTAGAGLLSAQQKKRIAIIDFDYGTVRSGVAALFGTDVDVGKGISDVLVEKLLAGGKYSVIERRMLDKVLAEQNFSNSNRAHNATAAQIGKLLGVEAIVVGSITQFGRDDKSQGVGGAGMGGLNKWGLGGVKRNESKAVVGISARLIDVNSGEILAAMTGQGASERKGVAVTGGGGSGAAGGLGGVDFRSTNFANTLIGEAVYQAVGSLAGQLDSKAASLPTVEVLVNGLVADVSGNTLILNVGTSGGVKVGDRLGIYRKVREVKDPETGKILRAIENHLGSVTITEADGSSSVGTFSGGMPPKVGDTVKTIK